MVSLVLAAGAVMRNASALVLILMGIGAVAAYVASPRVEEPGQQAWFYDQAPALLTPTPQAIASSDRSAVIVSVPQRPITQVAQVPAEEPRPILSMAGNHSSLANALQRELQRVGCYNGEISGIWTTSSRIAMQTFLGRVNAALPTDEPDIILLSLVQAHEGTACSKSCPAGAGFAPSGECLPNSPITTKFRPRQATGVEASNPIITGSLPAGTPSAHGLRLAPTAAELSTTAPEQKPGDRQPKQGRPSTPQPLWEPPKFVRTILKTVQSGMKQLGLP